LQASPSRQGKAIDRTLWGTAHSEQFEQALSFTRPSTDGFKSSVRLGTVADRRTEARAAYTVQQFPTIIFLFDTNA
jgi:hypothetical protein